CARRDYSNSFDYW
nr:immunoglobulin heavy chain junction region [Mus musculus]MBK4195707.1 immunoglobulin heavy chain junction region [Mus musculus]